MNPTPSFQSPAAVLSRARYRAAQRASGGGAVMFVVAMTIAVLAGLGAWALQSAALEVRMAGYERQNTQTHYISEYGILAGMQAAPSVVKQVVLGGPTVQGTCLAAPWASVDAANATNIAKECLVWPDAQYTLQNTPNTLASYQAPPTNTAYAVPATGPYAIDPSAITASGSLGYSSVQGDFRVEMTEAVSASSTAKAGNNGSLYWVTLSSYGQTGLSAGTAAAQYGSEGTETLRARVLVPAQ